MIRWQRTRGARRTGHEKKTNKKKTQSSKQLKSRKGDRLTIRGSDRFKKSRDVGCYVGLRPKRSESGESQPQLRITKQGDVYLRTLLVRHNGDPVLGWAMGNVVARKDPKDNVYPSKVRDENKIDPAVALIANLSLHLRQKEVRRSVYESPGVTM